MCEYCSFNGYGYSQKSLLEIDGKHNIEINMFKSDNKIEIVGVGSFDYDSELKINFCPMCGRNLNE